MEKPLRAGVFGLRGIGQRFTCANPAFTLLMRRIALYAIVLILVLPSCSNRAGGSTTMVVKPKNHHWWFDKKKDKRKKRTKIVRMRN